MCLSLFITLLMFFTMIILNFRDVTENNAAILGPPDISVYPLSSDPPHMIWLRRDRKQHYIDQIKSLLRDHKLMNCTHDSNKTCGFNLKLLGPCADEPYGYEDEIKAICVYLLVNKIFNWVPECFNFSWSLPSEIPLEVRTQIQTLHAMDPDMNANHIWVACTGLTAADNDNIYQIKYHPYPGFDSKYFPYKKETMPIVAIRILGLKRKTLVTIECRLYAKNIPKNTANKFQIYIE